MLKLIRTLAILALLALVGYTFWPYLEDIRAGNLTWGQAWTIVQESRYWILMVILVIGIVVISILRSVIGVVIALAVTALVMYLAHTYISSNIPTSLTQKAVEYLLDRCGDQLSWDITDGVVKINQDGTVSSYTIDTQSGGLP